MKKLILTPLVATSIATCALLTATPTFPVSGSERAAITAGADDSLLALRAGAPAATVSLGSDERATLQLAQTTEPELLDMRAGFFLTQDEC